MNEHDVPPFRVRIPTSPRLQKLGMVLGRGVEIDASHARF